MLLVAIYGPIVDFGEDSKHTVMSTKTVYRVYSNRKAWDFLAVGFSLAIVLWNLIDAATNTKMKICCSATPP